ncbi:site-specific integrase [Blautia sp.]|uniref:site-specific integrase n=1 Tax=Blautia sp. TaxID=1955243 RepID=UPI0035219BB4
MRKRKMYLSVEDIAELFGLSVSFAYRVVERMNADLASKNYYVILGRVLTRYVEDKIYGLEHVEQHLNPCRKAGAIGKSKGEPKDFWMQEEFNVFLETVSDKPETRKAFLLLYWTGMRIGELLALTYNDINLEEKTISINKSYQRLKGKDMITQPKTPKSIRVITMPDFLAEEFREYCSHLYGIMKKERLFRFTKSHMEHCMATGIERSGVKRIRLHDLRHSHARNRKVFLPTGIKRWTESEKYGKISIRNDIVKSEFIKEDMDETVFMFALFKCRKFDKRRN